MGSVYDVLGVELLRFTLRLVMHKILNADVCLPLRDAEFASTC